MKLSPFHKALSLVAALSVITTGTANAQAGVSQPISGPAATAPPRPNPLAPMPTTTPTLAPRIVRPSSVASVPQLQLTNVPYTVIQSGPQTVGAVIAVLMSNLPRTVAITASNDTTRVDLTVSGEATGTFQGCTTTHAGRGDLYDVTVICKPQTASSLLGRTTPPPTSPPVTGPAATAPPRSNPLAPVPTASPTPRVVHPSSVASVPQLQLTNVPYTVIQSGPQTVGAVIAVLMSNLPRTVAITASNDTTRVDLTVSGEATGTFHGCTTTHAGRGDNYDVTVICKPAVTLPISRSNP